ncbi:hypothetical protein DL764_010025 [Monosporascus ibericus]|uniref:Uncharacterized protein n=1 Tax=Monosporascus ibericus TaxID=155417 RepID=A0A4Q4SVU7_9PEZI|nr:hypothetical protein DL764_010025 [Monosporascus ibericus]
MADGNGGDHENGGHNYGGGRHKKRKTVAAGPAAAGEKDGGTDIEAELPAGSADGTGRAVTGDAAGGG